MAIVSGLGLVGAATSVAAQAPGVDIELIAHASFLIRSPQGVEVLIDPFADRVWLGYDFPRGIDPDVILVTHPHYDHDAGAYRGMPSPWPDHPALFQAPGTHRIGDVRVVGIEGRHADPYGQEFGQINTLWVVEVGGLRIAHLGDNGPLTSDNVTELGEIDVLMLPVDGEYHILSAQQVAATVTAVAPRIVIPMHYRHPELEPGDGPDDLGPIEPWLEQRLGVVRLGSHHWEARADTLLPRGSILVFEPSPLIPRLDRRP